VSSIVGHDRHSGRPVRDRHRLPRDGDGIADRKDDCPKVANPDQANHDGDAARTVDEKRRAERARRFLSVA
jgi:hypothetical protein